jgi:hypothetical protein
MEIMNNKKNIKAKKLHKTGLFTLRRQLSEL